MPATISLERHSGLPSEGQHVFKVVRASEEEGSAGPYWRYILQVQGSDEAGREMMLNLSLSSNARWKIDQFLDAMEAPGKGTARMEEFVGRSFMGNVVHEVYEGAKKAALADMSPYSGTAPPKPSTTTPDKQAELPLDVVDEEEEDFPF